MHSRTRDQNFEIFLVASIQTHGRGEKTQLSSGWTLIGSELSSPNFNSLVRAERSFAIRYPNVVIKPLCSNIDICLNYQANAYFRSRNSVRVLSVANATESHRCFFGLRFSVANKPSTRMHLLAHPGKHPEKHRGKYPVHNSVCQILG